MEGLNVVIRNIALCKCKRPVRTVNMLQPLLAHLLCVQSAFYLLCDTLWCFDRQGRRSQEENKRRRFPCRPSCWRSAE